MPSEPIDDPAFALAASLHAAWQHADADLRVELERVIREYVQREPSFLNALRHVVAMHETIIMPPKVIRLRQQGRLRPPFFKHLGRV